MLDFFYARRMLSYEPILILISKRKYEKYFSDFFFAHAKRISHTGQKTKAAVNSEYGGTVIPFRHD